MTAHAYGAPQDRHLQAQNLEWSQVNVEGLSPREVENALELYRTIIQEQLDERSSLTKRLAHSYLTKSIQLIPEATQRQAQRSVAFRARLLEEEGVETYESLATLRGTSQSTVRTWVARQREQLHMFTIEVEGKTLIPKVQLTRRGTLNDNVSAIIAPLLKVDIGSWGLWSWLTAPTGLLSDEVPAVVADKETERAVNAAELYAEDLRDAKERIA